MNNDKTVCIVRGTAQKEYLTTFMKSQYPNSCVHIIDSIKSNFISSHNT